MCLEGTRCIGELPAVVDSVKGCWGYRSLPSIPSIPILSIYISITGALQCRVPVPVLVGGERVFHCIATGAVVGVLVVFWCVCACRFGWIWFGGLSFDSSL